MGDARYAVALSKARKLERFLFIIGRPTMPLNAFNTDMVLQFRQFLYDEYKYVPQFPALYPRGAGHRPPTRRLKDTTVVHDLKLMAPNFKYGKQRYNMALKQLLKLCGITRPVSITNLELIDRYRLLKAAFGL